MCQSLAEGGLRCVAHTGPAVVRAEAAFAASPSPASEDALIEAYAEHAMTEAGRNALAERQTALWNFGDVRSTDEAELGRLSRAFTLRGHKHNQRLEVQAQVKWEPKARSASAVERVEALQAQRHVLPGNTKNLSDATLVRLSHDSDPGVRKALASYRARLPEEVAFRLATDPDPEIREALAKTRASLAPVVARTLMDRATPELRLNLAKQWHLPVDVVSQLQGDADPKVRAALLFSREDGAQLACHRGRSKDVVVKGLTDPSAQVRLAALNAWRGASAEPLADRNGQSVGFTVWSMPSPELVTALENDPSAKVRGRVADAFELSRGDWTRDPARQHQTFNFV